MNGIKEYFYWVAKIGKIIKIQENDRFIESVTRKTLVNKGFVVIARKDCEHKTEIGLIHVNPIK